ncbi:AMINOGLYCOSIDES/TETRACYCLINE-TRANSPORT INTEGRAL MEMBRANE PROTEIN [hydrothermal vent metagenome]|uniref:AMINOGLYCOSIDES/TETRACYCLINE-TRANSPORT INTEGRAL MEMBRANE PROTEIN n=1 Tax=hydrothermal vent metagenome TaxID=652676 RepID=A0A160V8R7_9ZZZZ
MLAPLLVDIAAEFDVSVAVAGQVGTATFAAWAISVVSVGPLSDSLGRRSVALVGLSLLAVGVLASAFAPNLETLMVTRVVTGLGGGMIPPNGMAAVVDVVPPARLARAIGTLISFTTLSAVIGVPAVALMADLGSWRLPFLVIGSLLTACIVLNWFWFPKNEAAKSRTFAFLSRYRDLLALPVLRSILAANLAQRIAYMAIFSYLATYLIDDYGVSVGAVALPLALVGIGGVIGSYIGGMVATHPDRMSLIAASAIGGGVAAAALFSVDLPVWAVVAISTVSIALLSLPWTVMIAVCTEISGNSRATGVGLVGVSNQTGAVGGAALGGLLLAVSGFPGIGYLCLGAVVFSAVVIVVFMRSAGAGATLLPYDSARSSAQTDPE